MPKTVTLLKPFHFSRPPVKGTKLPTEIKFYPQQNPKTKEWIPTEVDLDDDIASHEWISKSYADGAIERPEVTKARLEKLHAQQKIQQENNAAELARAEQALLRATGAHETQQRTENKVAQELNTPVNALGAQQGSDIDKAALEEELNTLVNALGAQQGSDIDKAALEEELNTPVNALGAQQGSDIDKAALEEELNTPISELRANGGKAKPAGK